MSIPVDGPRPRCEPRIQGRRHLTNFAVTQGHARSRPRVQPALHPPPSSTFSRMAPIAVDSAQSSPISVASLKQSLPSSGKSGAQQPVIQKPFADSCERLTTLLPTKSVLTCTSAPAIAASYGSLALVSAKHSGDIDPNRPNAEHEGAHMNLSHMFLLMTGTC